MDERKLIDEVKSIIAIGARGPSPSIVPRFIDALFEAPNKTIPGEALVGKLYPEEWEARTKGTKDKLLLRRKQNGLEKFRRLVNERLYPTPYLFQIFITLSRGEFGILTQPDAIFKKRLEQLEQLPKEPTKKKGKNSKQAAVKRQRPVSELREELESRWDDFQERSSILELLAAIEQNVNKIGFFHSHEEVPIQDQYISVQVTLERQYTHDVESFYSYPGYESDELKHVYSFSGFPDRPTQNQISWEEARTKYDKIMVLADPGMGKSTLLKITCLQIATLEKQKLETDRRSDAPQDAIIPLCLELDDLAASGLEIVESVCDIARREYPKASDRTMKMLRQKMEEGKCVLLLDALDLVELEQVRELSKRLTRFSKNYKCRIICSSRIVGYLGHFLDNSIEVEIVPFDPDKKREYIQSWFKNSKGTIKSKNATAKGLLQELDAKPKVHDLAQIPLLLSLICSLYAYGKISLPARRVEIYRQAVELMLGEVSLSRKPRSEKWIEPKKQILEKTAYEFSCQGLERLPERKLSKTVDSIRSEMDEVSDLRKLRTADLIDELSRDDGILTIEQGKQGKQYLFLHRTFQEYFAASYINQVMQEDLAAGLKLAHDHFWHLDWHETISLLAGLMDDPGPLLEAIVLKEKDDVFGTMLDLGGRCVAECSDVSHPVIRQIVTRLVDFWDNHPFSDYLEPMLFRLGRTNEEICNLVVEGAIRHLLSDRLMNTHLFRLLPKDSAVEPLIRALQSTDPKLKRAAAIALGSIGAKRAVTPLIKALQHDDKDLKHAAAFALRAMGDKRAVEPLIGTLQDPDNALKRTAAIALGTIGDERAVEPLIKALQIPDPHLGYAAASSLAEIGGKRAVEALIEAFRNPDEDLKRAAASALVEMGDELVIRPLIKLLKDPDQYLRIEAASVLAERGDKRGVEPLIKILRNRDQRAKRAAVIALGTIRDERAVGPLIKMLEDPDQNIGHVAAIGLAKPGNERAVKPLIKILQDRRKKIRDKAAFALGMIGDKRAVDPLIETLDDSDQNLRCEAASALRHMGDERAVEPLIKALQEPYQDASDQEAFALARVGNERALNLLIKAIQEPLQELRCSAASALAEIRDERVLGPLITAIQEPYIKLICAAASAFSEIGNRRAVQESIAALIDPYQKLRCAAASALAEIGDKRAVEPLIVALQHPEQMSMGAAGSALGAAEDRQIVGSLIKTFQDEKLYDALDSAFEKIENKQVVESLNMSFPDPYQELRREAATALGVLGDKRAVEPLIWALQDPDQDLRSRAASALAGIGDERAFEPLIKALEDASPHLKIGMVNVLKMFSNETCVRGLVQLSADDDKDVQEYAMGALGQSTYPEALEILLERPLGIMRSKYSFYAFRELSRRRMNVKSSPLKIYPENLHESLRIKSCTRETL